MLLGRYQRIGDKDLIDSQKASKAMSILSWRHNFSDTEESVMTSPQPLSYCTLNDHPTTYFSERAETQSNFASSECVRDRNRTSQAHERQGDWHNPASTASSSGSARPCRSWSRITARPALSPKDLIRGITVACQPRPCHSTSATRNRRNFIFGLTTEFSRRHDCRIRKFFR